MEKGINITLLCDIECRINCFCIIVIKFACRIAERPVFLLLSMMLFIKRFIIFRNQLPFQGHVMRKVILAELYMHKLD